MGHYDPGFVLTKPDRTGIGDANTILSFDGMQGWNLVNFECFNFDQPVRDQRGDDPPLGTLAEFLMGEIRDARLAFGR